MVSKSIVVLLLLGCLIGYAKSQVVGGLEDEKPADEHINKVLSSVQSDLKSKFPRGYVSIEPLSYRTQVVAGMNYFVKAIVTERNGKKSHAHLRIYRPFRGDNELTAIKTDVTKEEPLKYFQ